MTAQADSTLGREADVCLTMPSVAEACPNGLAPTTSTTMQLVLGDALAIALLEGRGFTALDFQALHPGGKLGARLAHVREVMHTGERVPRIAASARMAEAIVEMTSKGFGCVAVIEDRDRLVGILTDGDLRRYLKPGFSLDTEVASVMTKKPRTIAPDALVAEALESDQPQDLGASGGGARPGGRDRTFPRSDAHRRVLIAKAAPNQADWRHLLRQENPSLKEGKLKTWRRPFPPGATAFTGSVAARGSSPKAGKMLRECAAPCLDPPPMAGSQALFRARRASECCSSSVVEHSLGKGEVESSILSCSTIISMTYGETADRRRNRATKELPSPRLGLASVE